MPAIFTGDDGLYYCDCPEGDGSTLAQYADDEHDTLLCPACDSRYETRVGKDGTRYPAE